MSAAFALALKPPRLSHPAANARCRRNARMVVAPPKPGRTVQTKTKTVRKAQMPKMYRLFIINDPFNSKARVVEVLLKVCQGLTFSRAQAAMEEAHNHGRGLVMILHQELAEHYCSTINSAGIFSTVEPEN